MLTFFLAFSNIEALSHTHFDSITFNFACFACLPFALKPLVTLTFSFSLFAISLQLSPPPPPLLLLYCEILEWSLNKLLTMGKRRMESVNSLQCVNFDMIIILINADIWAKVSSIVVRPWCFFFGWLAPSFPLLFLCRCLFMTFSNEWWIFIIMFTFLLVCVCVSQFSFSCSSSPFGHISDTSDLPFGCCFSIWKRQKKTNSVSFSVCWMCSAHKPIVAFNIILLLDNFSHLLYKWERFYAYYVCRVIYQATLSNVRMCSPEEKKPDPVKPCSLYKYQEKKIAYYIYTHPFKGHKMLRYSNTNIIWFMVKCISKWKRTYVQCSLATSRR